MNAIFDQYKGQLQQVAEKWFATLKPSEAGDARLVRQALLLFQEQQVHQLKIENNRLTGMVHDDAPESVMVHLSFLEMSSCSCPANYYCRHQLAVFLTAYNNIASVEQLVEKWQAPIALKQVTEQFGLTHARALLTEAPSAEPQYDEMVATISAQFDLTFGEGLRTGNPYMLEQMYSIYSGRIKANAPDKQEWRHLYYVIVSIISFKKLMNLCELVGCEEQIYQRHYKRIFMNIREMADRNIRRLHIHSVPFSFDAFIESLRGEMETLLVIRTRTDQPHLSHEIIGFYALFWDHFFKKNSWRMAELERLQALIDDTEPSEQQYIFSMCYVQLLFLHEKDEEVFAHLKDADLRMVEHVVLWIAHLRTLRQWRRFELYFDFVFQASQTYVKQLPLDRAREQFVQLLAQEAHHYCAATGKFDLYEKVLTDMLPYSLRLCSDFYFNNGQYEKWIEVMTLQQYGVSEINAYKLVVIEKEDMRLLLPLYHQSIQHAIDLKNRNNYRYAVKQLQKLKTIYRKLDEMDRWNVYLRALLENTRRLRAFQEECRIGKLLV